MKLHKHYCYVLSHKGVPFYVGVSTNPVARLYLHRISSGEMLKKLRRIRLSEVSINIVGHVITRSIGTCIKCYQIEHAWIKYYLELGFELLNISNRPQWENHIKHKRTKEQAIEEHTGCPPKKHKLKLLQP